MGGVLLIVAGTWVLCQVWGGNALGRLGITGQATEPGTTGLGRARGSQGAGQGPGQSGSRDAPELPLPLGLGG